MWWIVTLKVLGYMIIGLMMLVYVAGVYEEFEYEYDEDFSPKENRDAAIKALNWPWRAVKYMYKRFDFKFYIWYPIRDWTNETFIIRLLKSLFAKEV